MTTVEPSRLYEIVETEANKTAEAKESLKPAPRRLKFHRFSTVELLVALALLFLFFPFVEEVKGGDVIISILLSLVLLSAVLAVADRKGVFFIALVLAIPAIAGGGSIISGRTWSHRPCFLSQDSP